MNGADSEVDMPFDIRPSPDPTVRTSQQVHHEVGALRQLMEVRFEALQRADGLRRDKIDHIFPQEVEKLIGHLAALQNERFAGVERQFLERDVRGAQSAIAGSAALAAALQAAKELVGAQGEASAAAAVKSETSFTKQIDQIGTIIGTLEKALTDRITEIKERIDRGEGVGVGQIAAKTDRRLDRNLTVAILSATFVGISVIVAMIVAFHR